MDTLTLAIILLVAFVAYQQAVWWLFGIMIVLFLLLARSVGVSLLVIAGFGVLYLFKLQQHWFIFMVLIVGLAIVINERKKPAGAGEEAMSPELMQLLGQYGGEGGV